MSDPFTNWFRRSRAWLGQLVQSPPSIVEQTQAMSEIRIVVEGVARRLETLDTSFVARLERLEGEIVGRLGELSSRMRHLEAQGAAQSAQLAGRIDQRAEHLERALDPLAVRLAELEQVKADLRRVEHLVRDLARQEADNALRSRLPPPTRKQPGLSMLLVCQDHGDCLEQVIGSALSVLDELESAAELLVLDDASRDDTPQVAGQLIERQARVRLFRAEAPLGLARARNLLLDQARFRHALVLAPGHQLVAGGVEQLHRAAVETSAALLHGILLELATSGKPRALLEGPVSGAEACPGDPAGFLPLIDVETVREIGGYTRSQPGCEDRELHFQLLRRDRAILHVPVVVGRHRPRAGEVVQVSGFAQDTSSPVETWDRPGAVYHPATGHLRGAWASEPTPARSIRRVLVVSGGGQGNLGEDAILLATLERLDRVAPEHAALVVTEGDMVPSFEGRAGWAGTCSQLVASLEPGEVRQGCLDAPQVAACILEKGGVREQRDTFPVQVLAEFDLVVFTGGEWWNAPAEDLPLARSAIAAAARAHGVPYLASGQGIGPLEPDREAVLRLFLRGAARFGVRDPLSYDFLSERGLAGPRVDRVVDDAVGLAEDGPDERERRVHGGNLPTGRPVLGFQVGQAPGWKLSAREMREWILQVDRVACESGWNVLALPAPGNSFPSRAWLTEFGPLQASWSLPEAITEVRTLRALVRACDHLLAWSHPLGVFALEAAIPVLLVTRGRCCDREAVGLARQVGLPLVWQIGSPDLRARIGRLDAWDRTTRLKSDLADAWLARAVKEIPPRSVASIRVAA